MTIEVAGLPSVGRSALFNALTRATALATNYPFATIEPNVGAMPLPDARLDKPVELFHPAKAVLATVSFVDIVGVVCGTSQGEDLGNQFLANIREADAICLATCAFADPDVVRVESRVDPKDDAEAVTTELVLADVQALEKQIPRLTKEVTGEKTPEEVLEAAEVALELFEQRKVLPVYGTGPDPVIPRGFSLMAMRKSVYVFNTDDAGLADEAMQVELCNFMAPVEVVFLDAKFKAELVELEPEEAHEMLEASGQDEVGLNKLARVGSGALGLQAYLMAGGKEARAWTIHKGWTMPQAAGAAHTDLECGFIKAGTVSCDDLVECGSLAEARVHGRARMEGRDYVMADGDVVEFHTGLMSKK